MTKQENEERLARLKSIVLSMPEKPGSYQYYDENHTIIYVGKAKNLKRRVSSYFHKEVDRYKTKVLVSKIFDISYTVVNTEEDALLLENSLIKKYNPRYNVLLKDGKTYPSICVTNEYFPRIFKHASRIVKSLLAIVVCVIVSKTAGLDGVSRHNANVARLSLKVPALFDALRRIR